MVGFTDWISTRGPSAFALIETSVGAKATSKQSQTLLWRVSIVCLIRCLGRFGNICSCETLEKKAGAVFGYSKTQLEIGVALCLDFRQLRVKQQLRLGQTQPLLRIVAQIPRNIGCLFRSIHFYQDSGFYRILQVHCKPDQLRSIE